MRLFSRLIQWKENRVRKEALYVLGAMSERQLRDCGLSLELINEGVNAWPWKAVQEELPAPLIFSSLELVKSVSDKQLNRIPGQYVKPETSIRVERDAA